jgi:hypothetical protein
LEAGLFLGAANAVPADGVFIRQTSAGLYGVLIYNGTETATSVFAFAPTAGVNYQYTINIYENEVEFWIQLQGVDAAVLGEIAVPNGNGQPFLSTALPFCVQSRNTGSVTSPCTWKMSDLHVDQRDIDVQIPFAVQQAGAGLTIHQGSSGGTMGPAFQQWSNTAEPTAAAATNTTAALGAFGEGLFKANAMATSATDLKISSYLNPVGSVNQTPRTMVIAGCWVDVCNEVVAVATTATTFAVSIAYGHTAISLATTETGSFVTASAKTPRRVPLGFLYLPVAAVVGQPSNNRIYAQFQSPIVVNPGEYLDIVAKVVVGTATATETFLFLVGFDGYLV